MSEDNRRSHLRYNPDKNSVMSIISDGVSGSEELIGLLRDISEGGCAGVFHADYFNYTVGDELDVTTDEVSEQKNVIVWKKSLDKKFVKVGFEFCR